jgi:hypothetical protein
MHSISGPSHAPRSPEVQAIRIEVDRWVKRRRWEIRPEAPALDAIAELLVTLHQFNFPITINDVNAIADAAEPTAAVEVEYARAMQGRAAAVETMVIGTLVVERLTAEVRRLALEAASARLDKVKRTRRKRAG